MARLRTALFGLALLAGSASIAAAQTATPGTPPAAGRQDSVRRRPHGDMKHGKRAGGGRGMRALFRGVQLTPEQRTQVRQIAAKYQPQRQELAKSMQPAMADVRAARQRGDSAAAKAAFARTADTRAKLQALRDQQLRDVRAILTPTQQQAFDRNVTQVKERMEKQHQNRGRRHGRRA